MSTVGKRLLSSLVYTNDLQQYIKLSLEPYLFKDTELPLYELMAAHIAKYGKIPSQSTIEDIPGFEDAMVDAPEPPQFYMDEVEKRYLHNSLKSTVQEASMLLTDKLSEAALDVIMKHASTLHRRKQRKHLFDFREASDLIKDAYLAQKVMGTEIMLPYGWETLDNMSGGMRGGDFVTFVGRPMAGKTFKLLYTALNAWRTAGRVPLFVSMEMTALIIQQRLAAMTAKKKLTDIIKAELSTKAFNAMMDTLHDLKQAEVPFWVMDANLTSTPEDVLFYCHQLQPSAVFVDGAYLMEGDKKMGKWDVQADNARKLKQRIATDLDVPVVASYQLSKGSAKAKKKGKGEPDGMEDVHGSDEMAQLSTVMLGLFDDETNIEAKKRRTVKILKGRNGETGQFTINWDFSANMNFTEYVPEDPTTMQMEHLG